jgi:hypothetical protein
MFLYLGNFVFCIDATPGPTLRGEKVFVTFAALESLLCQL